ncbi:c-type cytochrome [Oricola cellulosilytica]|uniref:Cytochrome c n=1 Tax=Oricola cellulosilytica TaxID=1429082 RepID=A0A4R0PEB4_9HYPH|nr:cytochrome c [Oricola cellulosilytica]TCD16137.1 cytochrome c [Oricola cellulosilytica]
MTLKRTLAFAALAVTLPVMVSAGTDSDKLQRGAYLAQIMDCAGCHMPRGAGGEPLADAGLSGGNIGFEMADGTIWPPNLTPHATGLGGWTSAQIINAVRYGVRPDGRALSPAMPWMAYSALTPEDAGALAAYLMSVEPVERTSPDPSKSDHSAPFYRVVVPD